MTWPLKANQIYKDYIYKPVNYQFLYKIIIKSTDKSVNYCLVFYFNFEFIVISTSSGNQEIMAS